MTEAPKPEAPTAKAPTMTTKAPRTIDRTTEDRTTAPPTTGSPPIVVETVDYHTAGEPFGIVSTGLPAVAGDTVAERRAIVIGAGGSATTPRPDPLGPDDELRHESITGTVFTGRLAGSHPPGLLTEVTGTAYRTGEHRFLLHADDTPGTGFLL
ncbi:proline racemase family protein [Streptomyces sp. SID3343]|uniref:proline racemase family protein n=1 Tax=Streptomyces sp. SID3343 TaxID=2690260 RepID=UPI0013712BA2|nr:proline racemase family protein [Streptomyces sp. SID3343]MYW00246.1 hypothetical protein [Streptomyces sp. SID3343]